MQHTLSFIKEQLRNFYPESEIKSFSYLILESVCGLDKHSVLRGKDTHLSLNERLRIQKIVEDLKKYRPIQYILGETEFYGLKFKVDENVLIPRPETEELVDLIRRSDLSPNPSPQERGVWNRACMPWKRSCLDIGAGSGCIAVALAKNLPYISVYAMDISEKALKIARQNADANQVKVQFLQHDILADWPTALPEKWDIIVSNPPYITPEEKETMLKNVLDYEPHQALFVPQEKPLLFYERIAGLGVYHLKETGALYFEINAHYGKETVEMLQAKNYRTVQLFKDISGKDRMIKAIL
jgi:release factor glutamine methyltransferase